MRAISLSTLDKYRKNAKHDKNIPNDVLKVKLNCLIDAVGKENIITRGDVSTYQFGTCIFHVRDNIITDIRWENEDRKPNEFEIKRMITLYIRNGLNKNGNKFIDLN